MKKFISLLVSIVLITLSVVPVYAGTQSTLNINSGAVSHDVSPTLYGISLDDSAFASDGGLGAQMVNNNSFEYSLNGELAWKMTDVSTALSTQTPLNKNNPTYETVSVDKKGELSNLGYAALFDENGEYSASGLEKGAMHFTKGETYTFTCFLKNENYDGKIGVYLNSSSNKNDVVQLDLGELNNKSWKKFTAKLTSSANEDGELTVKFSGSGALCIDSVSLTPDSSYGAGDEMWKNACLRPDLVSALKELKPGFIRFPGTCTAESDDSSAVISWKDTIGKPEERRQTVSVNNDSDGGVYLNSSDYVGYHEYFQLCDDLGATPVPEVSAGVACQTNAKYDDYVQALNKTYMTDEQFEAYLSEQYSLSKSEIKSRVQYINSLGINSKADFDNYVSSVSLTPGTDKFKNYVQDVLDLIEYANGDSKTTYFGSLRAQNGSVQPFEMKYIQIGGDNYGEAYWRNFAEIKKAVNEKYPDITVVASCGTDFEGSDFEDAKNKIAASYSDVTAFESIVGSKEKPLSNFVGRYDSYARDGANVIASVSSLALDEKKQGRSDNAYNACDTAAFMLGAEKNSDVVSMLSYSKALSKSHADKTKTSLIWFDNENVVLTPEYYVQMLFANNVGTKTLSADFTDRPQGVTQSVTIDEKSQTLYVKLVNTGGKKEKINANLNGFDNLATASVLSLESEYKTAYNSNEKQTVAPKSKDIQISGDSFTVTLQPYSATVVRIPYGTNVGASLYKIPNTVNTEVKSYIPMSVKMLIILMVVIFILATVITYFVYSKVVLKGKKPDFKNKNKPNDKDKKEDE